jgi:hypothetical protein
VTPSGEQLQETPLEPAADVHAEGVRQAGGEGGLGRQLTSVPVVPTSLRVAEPSSGEPHAAQRLEDTRDELDRLSRAYDDALRRGLRARERADIAAAFDEGDSLQWRIMSLLRRARELEHQLAAVASAERHELALAGAPDNAA